MTTHRIRPLVAIAAAIAATAAAAAPPLLTVPEALRDFRQRRSGVCVNYAHIIAWAEADPDRFAASLAPAGDGWEIRLANGSKVTVAAAEEALSLRERYSGGTPGNPINIVAIAASKAGDGFDEATGRLDYGHIVEDSKCVIGGPRWTLYDNHQEEPDRTWHDGLDRLVREARPNGRPGRPSTVGFADMSSPPEVETVARRNGLVGAHDFTVSGVDPATGIVRLRNPHNPTRILGITVDDLKQLPGGIDFMELPDPTKTP